MSEPPNPQVDSFILPKDRPTDRQYAAIGRVVAIWSVVELGMERILSALALSPSLLGFVLTDRLGPENRISAIRSLVKVHQNKYASELVDPQVLDEIDTLLKIIAKMKDDRNFIAHSVWHQSGPEHLGRVDLTGAAKSGFDFSQGQAERVSSLEAFADEVQKAADRTWELARQISGVDVSLLTKLSQREQENRRLPPAKSTRFLQRRQYSTF